MGIWSNAIVTVLCASGNHIGCRSLPRGKVCESGRPGSCPSSPGMRTFFTLAGNTNVMEPPVILTRVLPGDLIHNFPVLSLIFANLVTIVLAILGNWDLATVMFIYWAQSIIIGIFYCHLAPRCRYRSPWGRPPETDRRAGRDRRRSRPGLSGSTSACLPGSSPSTTASSTGDITPLSWSPGSSGP